MPRLLHTTRPLTCSTCEIRIANPPTFRAGLPFCCTGCAADGPCTWSYDAEPAAEIRHCLDVMGAVEGRLDDRTLPLAAARRR